MIIDDIKNIKQYYNLNINFNQIEIFIKANNLSELPQGRYSLIKNNDYVNIDICNAREINDAKLESHKKYIDVQLLISGNESMGWKTTPICKQISSPYNPEKDFQFFSDEPDIFFNLKLGNFVIFYPEDAHMPLLGTGTIKKAVFKISL